MSKTATQLWVMDDHDLRRAGLVGLLSSWASETSSTITEIDNAETIPPIDESTGPVGELRQMCILGIGGMSLSEESIATTVAGLIRVLNGRPLVVISDIQTTAEVATAIRYGIRGLIPTSMQAHVAVAAMQFILSGGSYLPVEPATSERHGAGHAAEPQVDREARRENRARIAELHRKKLNGAGSGALHDAVDYDPRLSDGPKLTPRQMDVLQFLSVGRSNKEIARTLDLSEATVKIHVRQLMRKYGAVNRTQVALLATGTSNLSATRH